MYLSIKQFDKTTPDTKQNDGKPHFLQSARSLRNIYIKYGLGYCNRNLKSYSSLSSLVRRRVAFELDEVSERRKVIVN